MRHPSEALYAGEPDLPALPACEHFAGSEKLIDKALQLQQELGPIFDITCDCEDGAPAGAEAEHARMVASKIASAANRHHRLGARVHDFSHPLWQQDIELILEGCGDRLAYLTLPKINAAAEARVMMEHVASTAARLGIARAIPFHLLIETHGGLREAHAIASLEGVETLDFGLLDFISDHHGAIPSTAMQSPGQFEHALIARAKTEIAAAALSHGVVPSHNVTTELRDANVIYQDAHRARTQFGYLRMYSIHPAQIDPIVRGMRPETGEVAMAAEILLSAQDADWGPTRHAGKLHDRASYRFFWQVLKSAHATGVDLAEDARNRFFS